MNKHQIIILWIFGVATLYVLDILPGLAYILLIAPAILYHAYEAKPATTSVSKMEHSDSLHELEEDEVTVDSEYTERIELEIGGYVELDCWKETPFEEATEEEKDRTPPTA